MHVGVLQAKILQFQLISDATTFRECHDPTEILQYNGEKLTGPKNKACLVTGSGTCIILPGVVASFKMLKKRLLKKIEEDNKRSKGNTINSSASPPTLVVNAVKSIDEQRNHISIAITHWFQTHRDDLNCTENASLEEKTDYRIEFNSVNELAIVISNYYRHIERGSCSVMLKKSNDKSDRYTSDNENNDDSVTNSASVYAIPKSPLINMNRKETPSKRKRSPSSAPATRRRTKHRRS
ncbi:unnamed protein product [Adineta ricciae]|uniref:Uncharacterized protein n=1 Tax=Adineta ricciae TaxID=249248 RepID=A0A816AWF4_ADIRI|nr:unnamed protein product [Adineta ricciae]